MLQRPGDEARNASTQWYTAIWYLNKTYFQVYHGVQKYQFTRDPSGYDNIVIAC